MKTKVIIEIETPKFRSPKEDGEELISEEDFHTSVREYIDDLITDADDFESNVLEKINDTHNIKVDEFQKFGGLFIKVQHLGVIQ